MPTDVRVRYTKMIIKENFVELLKKKHISKITVKEICELSEINRSTFYKHYEDVYDLLRSMIMEMESEFQTIIEKNQSLGTKRTIIETLERIKHEKDMYIPLFSENSDSDIMRDCIISCYEMIAKEGNNYLEGITDENKNRTLNFISWGCAGLLRSWYEDGMTQPTEEVADFSAKIITAAVNAARE